MIFVKIYFIISFILYFFLGLYLFLKKQLDFLTLLALIVISIFWLPVCIYIILNNKR